MYILKLIYFGVQRLFQSHEAILNLPCFILSLQNGEDLIYFNKTWFTFCKSLVIQDDFTQLFIWWYMKKST